jgi:hypothetical protein
MQCSPLTHVQQHLRVGAPLPFNIRDHDRTLLLARGQRVHTADQLQALLDRGALVDIDELLSPADRIRRASATELPGLWNDCLGQVNDTLRNAHDARFRDVLETASTPVLALVARDPDLAIFQVLRQPGNQHLAYGLNHSTHAAITALTMNISMLELQGQLAVQTTPPTDEQRAAIHAHPHFSRTMLEMAGVTDADWLSAVADHHESPDGSGYPLGRQTVGELAALVRRADIYSAKLSPRAGRHAMAADRAGRQMFMQEPGQPMIAALVKEFGVYPPGCFVRLASGEAGMVVRRGASVLAPVVAVPGPGNGTASPRCTRRDTSNKAYAVQSVLSGPPTEVPPKLLQAMLAS